MSVTVIAEEKLLALINVVIACVVSEPAEEVCGFRDTRQAEALKPGRNVAEHPSSQARRYPARNQTKIKPRLLGIVGVALASGFRVVEQADLTQCKLFTYNRKLRHSTRG
ncbi:hypothetical protein Bbelb_195790 [Branchiostoma belcheri]|nr:hypothetical protein Bbelb_195790 [Branchiostoma belcheri]